MDPTGPPKVSPAVNLTTVKRNPLLKAGMAFPFQKPAPLNPNI